MRMNISVPVELKDKMDDFEKNYNPNWSRVAQKAFRKYMKKVKRKYYIHLPQYEKLEDVPRELLRTMLKDYGFTLNERRKEEREEK